jgi:hypothetical protein
MYLISSVPSHENLWASGLQLYISKHGTAFLRSVRGLLVTANIVSSSPILVTLMMEALSSS